GRRSLTPLDTHSTEAAVGDTRSGETVVETRPGEAITRSRSGGRPGLAVAGGVFPFGTEPPATTEQ
ncbi:MAG: hypothetical protein ABEI99_08615, partial [Halobaculum sp.]